MSGASSPTPRLTPEAARAAGLSLPSTERQLDTGIVHLGLGAFARAHTIALTEAAMDAEGDDGWGIVGVSQRSATVPRQLGPQQQLFTVNTRSAQEDRLDACSALTGSIDGAGDPDAVVRWIADPRVRVVTMTVTEKGYLRGAAGHLDLDIPEVRRDLGGGRSTAIGQLVAGIRRRDGAPLTIVSCDNLPQNGRALRGVLEEFVAASNADDARGVADALRSSVTTPDTMVDRMVPATTPRDIDRVAARWGVRDEALVIAEPYRQWVLADDFAAGRPTWEHAGAIFVDDVAPWEGAKLRILNASHSLLAYGGLLAGVPTIAEVATRDEWAAAVRLLIDRDVAPSLDAPDGLDVGVYGESVIERFRNPHLGHTVAKVGADGSQKIGPRVLSTVRAARREGMTPRWAVLVVALWAAYAREAGSSLDDPWRARIVQTLRGSGADEGTLRLIELIAPDLAADAVVCDLARAWSATIAGGGLAAVASEILAES